MIITGFVGLFAAGVSFLLSYVVLRVGLRYRIHPPVRERDVHTTPTPRLGGIAIFGGFAAAFGVAALLPAFDQVFADPRPIVSLFAATGLMLVVGVVDDLIDLDWTLKLAAQFIAAVILAWFGGFQITAIPADAVIITSPVVSLLITVFAIVLTMNALNFIDGLDGLVAGVAIIANSVFFIVASLLARQLSLDGFAIASLVCAVLVGVLVGFLPFNWRPAKLFMGDGGALVIGLLMATSAIAVVGNIDLAALRSAAERGGIFGRTDLFVAYLPIVLPLAILVVPLLDFSLAVLRRLRAGKSPFSADRKHLHHRLLDMGHSHLHAVLIFYAWTGVVAVGMLLLAVLNPYWPALVFLAVGLVICTAVTLLPLSRRKAVEAAVQSTEREHSAVVAPFDPLDAASEDVPGDARTRIRLETGPIDLRDGPVATPAAPPTGEAGTRGRTVGTKKEHA